MGETDFFSDAKRITKCQELLNRASSATLNAGTMIKQLPAEPHSRREAQVGFFQKGSKWGRWQVARDYLHEVVSGHGDRVPKELPTVGRQDFKAFLSQIVSLLRRILQAAPRKVSAHRRRRLGDARKKT